MATKSQELPKRGLAVSTKERPDFKEPIAAYVFDGSRALVERIAVRDGKVDLPAHAAGQRVFLAPLNDALEGRVPTPALMERLGAYEPVLHGPNGALDRITIPGIVIDHWPLCFCWVRGRVVRASDNRPVCDARVHVCEVDRLPWWIRQLPDLDVLRLRDDLLDALRTPLPRPRPFPGPDPGPRRGPLFRYDPGALVGLNPQPDPPFERVALNPQPLPPGERVALNPQPLPPRELARLAAARVAALQLAPELTAALHSASTILVRDALVTNWKLVIPWLCLWPHWWWRFRCDEIATLVTDAQGRFERTIYYRCGTDQPDLYFWVEYDFGSGPETVYHPRIACHTYWNYVCGTDVTIRITDPRVPGCGHEPDLPGCQVVVLSLGRNVAVREVQTAGGGEGQTTAGAPFGATLEPRVDFSRKELIETKKVPYYRWSYRRLSKPDGGPGAVDASSVPLGTLSPMIGDVYRHYKVGTSYFSELMGPMPTTGINPAPHPNLFRIRPVDPPSGNEWIVLDERVDLATAYFETTSLAGTPTGPAPLLEDLSAGLYELTLELFDQLGNLVDWTAKGIDLRSTDQDAPFGPGVITTSPAPAYNRIEVAGHLRGFRMVVRVDNNRCVAEVLPLGGSVTPDPDCGFHTYNDPTDVVTVAFVARHPHKFADYGFHVTRGAGTPVGAVATSGQAGEAGTAGFTKVADFTYAKNVTVADLIGTTCPNAAFAEGLYVSARATDGYGTLSGYDRADDAAFALAVPCPACECEDDEKGADHGIH